MSRFVQGVPDPTGRQRGQLADFGCTSPVAYPGPRYSVASGPDVGPRGSSLICIACCRTGFADLLALVLRVFPVLLVGVRSQASGRRAKNWRSRAPSDAAGALEAAGASEPIGAEKEHYGMQPWRAVWVAF